MMNILFTCAGRRTYLLKYFKEQLAGRGLVVGADIQLSAPALSAADIKIAVPSVYAPDYIDNIIDVCKANDIKCIISLNDLELPILSVNKSRFEAIGVKVIVSDMDVIDTCFDKLRTAQFIKSIDLNTPRTFANFDMAVKAIESGKIVFPLILKPRWGSGSIGIERVENMSELAEMYPIIKRKVRKSILATASVDEDSVLIQEFIDGQEYGLDVMNDLSGNHRGVSIKKKLAMRAGETDKAMTVENTKLRAIGSHIALALKHIGNLDVDIFEKEGRYYVLELNPRFGGGFPFSYEAGVNFPGAIISWLDGKETDDSILKSKPGLTFAKCDYLVPV